MKIDNYPYADLGTNQIKVLRRGEVTSVPLSEARVGDLTLTASCDESENELSGAGELILSILPVTAVDD